jgi:CheY-like chemotaxis protein
MNKNTRILIVDDDPEATHGLGRLLVKRGYEIQEENDSSKALAAAKAFRPGVVILDFVMPNVHGGDVAWQLASDPVLRDTRMIICSGVASRGEIAGKLPPTEIPILEKPVDTEALLKLIAGDAA